MRNFLGVIIASSSLCCQHIEYSASGGMKRERFEGFKEKYNLGTFIETGTYVGDTTAIAAPFFENVYTIELAEIYYNIAKGFLEPFDNINLIQGYSEIELNKILTARGAASTMIFLDAHYSAGNTAKAKNDPPVLDELVVLSNYAEDDTVIILDDVRCFCSNYTRVTLDYYPRLKDLNDFVNTKFKEGFRFCIIGDQALIYNPEFYQDEVSLGVELLTSLYLADDKETFLELARSIPTVLSETEQNEMVAMARVELPSPMICYAAGIITIARGDYIEGKKFLNKAYVHGLQEDIINSIKFR